MTDREEGLKPCPFCGESPTIEPWHGGPKTKRMISCGNDDCGVQPMVSGNTKAIAADLWNRRAPQGTFRELIEAAESAANVLASNGVTVAAEELRDAIRQLDEK